MFNKILRNLFFLFDLGTSEDDVDVDIKYCGYCHTDIHLINNDWGFTTYPCVGGHEVKYFILLCTVKSRAVVSLVSGAILYYKATSIKKI